MADNLFHHWLDCAQSDEFPQDLDELFIDFLEKSPWLSCDYIVIDSYQLKSRDEEVKLVKVS